MLMQDKNVTAVLMLCASIAAVLALSATAETSASISKLNAPLSNLPRCVNSENDIAEIQHSQKANNKTPHKYDGYRTTLHTDTLHTDTTLELAARLAYAETLAANCAKQEEPIIDLVTSVIANRIRIRRGDVNSVVFQRDQFASSLNIYPESRYRDFLCPKDAELWSKVLTRIRTHLEPSKPNAPVPNDAVNYYLYRHSDRFQAPNWKLEEAPIADEKTRACIRVFRNPAWK